MSRLQISKVKYIELLNNEMQKQPQYEPGMMVKAVASFINPRGFIEVSGLHKAKLILDSARLTVDKKYWHELD